MTAVSKAQFKLMKAVEGGYVKLPGMTKEKAKEYTSENKSLKNLPEHKFTRMKSMFKKAK